MSYAAAIQVACEHVAWVMAGGQTPHDVLAAIGEARIAASWEDAAAAIARAWLGLPMNDCPDWPGRDAQVDLDRALYAAVMRTRIERRVAA